ncbi:MAG: hypothetical protein WCS85_05860 [Candidatus Peribacteraceae bacterium]
MMLTILTAIILGLSQPRQALAYLTPEEVLLREQASFYSLPDPYLTPNSRRVRSIVDERAQERTAKYPDPSPVLHAAAEDSSSSGAIETEEASTSSEGGSTGDNTDLSVVELRLLERYERRAIAANSVLSHQSAPLTPTGPEAYATVAIMLGSVGWTMYRAKRAKGWKF